MDLKVLADALAGRWAPGVVTPPSGYTNIRQSTAQPPNAINSFPFVIVWATQGDLTYNPGTLNIEHEFLVTFHYAKASGDTPREIAALEAWAGVLIAQLHTVNKLGVAGVKKAIPMRYELGVVDYAGYKWEAVTLTVHVWTEEAVQLVPA